MFKNLQDFLAGKADLQLDQDGKPTTRDIQIAIVALLAEAAHVNKEFDGIELSRVIGGMGAVFGLADVGSAELLEIGEFLRKEQSKLDEFINAINTAYSDDQKQRIMGLVWRVIAADGKADKYESTFAANLRVKLGLTLEQAVRARQLSSEAEFTLPDMIEASSN